MYAITHASTALILKQRFRVRPLWPLLVSVQAIELLWVVFVYSDIEHVRYTADAVHLDFTWLAVWYFASRRSSLG